VFASNVAERGPRLVAADSPSEPFATSGLSPPATSFFALAARGRCRRGGHRWPATHRLDVGHLFKLALESSPAGAILHAVAEEGVPIREVAEVIGRHLDLPVATIAPDDAAEHFGFLAGFLGLDSPASSVRTRELLDWYPTHPGLIDDLDQGHYFEDRSA
jgi:nucleoside-diphosphate-sugar epimerase